MAFRKVLALALLSLAASAPAPQQVLTQIHALPQQQFLRAVPNFQTVQAVRTVNAAPVAHSSHSQSHTSITHETPAVNVVRTVAQPTFLRTVAAAPQTHVVHHAEPTVVRTVAAAPQTHVVHHQQPTVVRTVAAAPVVHSASHVVHQQPATVSVVRQAAPAVSYVEPEVVEVEVEAKPNYSFGYSVADTRSGDSKTREETRDGDNVSGSYTVADPDGRIRKVTYTADKEHGFQAVVTYDGAPGPVAIPQDAPASAATTVSVAAPVQTEAVVVAARAQDEEEAADEEEPAQVRTITNAQTFLRAVPQTQFVTASANPTVHVDANNAVHRIHNLEVQQPTVVSHAAPQQQFIRLSNGQAFASTPFGLRAIQVVGNNGGFIRALPFAQQQQHLVHV